MFNSLTNSQTNLAKTVLVILLAIIIQIASNVVRKRLLQNHKTRNHHSALSILVSIISWMIFLVILTQLFDLNNLSLTISGLAALLVLGLSQAMSPIIGDVLASVTLASENELNVGDLISINSTDKKITGIVEEMDIRRVKIRDQYQHLYIFPNSIIDRNPWMLLASRQQLKNHPISDFINPDKNSNIKETPAQKTESRLNKPQILKRSKLTRQI